MIPESLEGEFYEKLSDNQSASCPGPFSSSKVPSYSFVAPHEPLKCSFLKKIKRLIGGGKLMPLQYFNLWNKIDVKALYILD